MVKAVDGNSVMVPSRTTAGLSYRVDLAIDGTLLCNCPAALNNLKCWHVTYLQEELSMNETSTALVPLRLAPTQALVPSERTLALINQTAQLALSGAIALPKELNTREKVAAVMLYGLELGLRPMTSLRHLYVVNGRVQPSAEVMAGLLISSEPDARLLVEELTDQTCTMRIIRPQRNLNATFTVTWTEIERAGLAKTDVALKYPQDRLRWHCTKRILRTYAPDAINALDQGAAVLAELADAQDDEELYNDGDDHAAAIDVDTETGEIMGPATTTEQQRRLIADWSASVEQQPEGHATLVQVVKEAKEKWPYAVNETGRFSSLSLTVDDATRFIAMLKVAAGAEE